MYDRDFLDELQMAAEAAGIEFDPATSQSRTAKKWEEKKK